jgi:hypothetical protein
LRLYHTVLPYVFCAVVSMVGLAYAAAQTDPTDLMRRVERQSSAHDESVQISMKLINTTGSVRHRNATFYRHQRAAGSFEDMKLIRFHSPPEMAGSAVLTLENADRTDDQWLYLPAYHTSRRVPSSNRSDRYMGTDFFYEDVSDDKIEQYRYSLIGDELLDGRRFLIIEQVPIAEEVKQESAYGKKVQWVDAERYLVVRIDYYDKQGNLFKQYEARGAIQVGDHWRWSEATMTNLKLNHKTVVIYSDRKLNQGLDSGLFTVRNLERGR